MTSVKQWIKIGKQMNWIIFFEKVGMDRTKVWVKRSMIICVKGEIMYFERFFFFSFASVDLNVAPVPELSFYFKGDSISFV